VIPEDPRNVRRAAEREELTGELLRILAAIESKEEALREHAKVERAAIADLRAMAKERRALLDGERGAQGILVGVLQQARDVRDRKGDS